MNRFLLLGLLTLLFFVNGFAQFSPKTKGVSSFVRFNNTETYFVLSEREELRAAQIKAIEENWTITKINLISKDSFQLVSKDVDKSFVYLHKMKVKGTGKKIQVLALVNGGYDDMTTYISNTLAYISIDNEGYEGNESDMIFRMPNLVHQLEGVVKLIKENSIAENSAVKVRNKMIKAYKKKAGILKNKILLIDRRYLNQKIISESEFLKLYKYEVMFVDKSAIIKAIKDKDRKYAYLISAVNLYKINTVTDCETGEIVFADFEEEDKISKEFNRNFITEDILVLNSNVRIGK